MALTHSEREVGFFFRLSVFLKGVDAVLEIVGGVLAFLVSPTTVAWLVDVLTRKELIEDPHDKIVGLLRQAAEHYSITGSTFLALYLLAHGLVKIFLVVGLLKNKMWAYPVSLVVLGMFMVYQLYRYSYSHSLLMLGLTIFDLIVVWLIWREYLIQRRHHSAHGR
ncbi:MAG: hypothetical protein B7X04_03230 [Parcubacteria group bacterium 21-54-25]|nr:MAG: hypothetical protein B7X04_03230 [Parcubacteria group bacterium 21-54-25]HQU08002.1 DUF2127 domain-containing protein [Candidatus Paceibacterota bacterium]